MGYLTVIGKMLTYSEYKPFIEKYKQHGLNQFLKIYDAHKNKFIEVEDLHWGEEIEYSLFYFDINSSKVKLVNDALRLI